MYDLSIINSIHIMRSVILENNIQTRIIINLCVITMIFSGKINKYTDTVIIAGNIRCYISLKCHGTMSWNGDNRLCIPTIPKQRP